MGQALLEQSETDPVMSRFLNRNYSGYLVPTNADIPELDILFVGEFDEEASPVGAKGLGELTPYRWRPRSPMPSITQPASGYATCQSPWRSRCETRTCRGTVEVARKRSTTFPSYVVLLAASIFSLKMGCLKCRVTSAAVKALHSQSVDDFSS